MADVLITDLTDQSRISRKTDGLRATRRFLVSNAGLATAPSGRLVDAVYALALPVPGDPHPYAGGLLCSEVSAETADRSSNSDMFVTCTYEPPNINNRAPSISGVCQFEAGATVAKKKFFTNNQGGLMSVIAVSNGNTLPAQPIEAEIDVPVPYMHFSRLEPYPLQGGKILQFTGRVNSVAWNPGVFTATPRTALCTAIRATLQGSAYMLKYEFQYAFDTYDVLATYISPQDKIPILTGLTGYGNTGTFPATDPRNGAFVNIPIYRVYPEADFSTLGLYTGQ